MPFRILSKSEKQQQVATLSGEDQEVKIRFSFWAVIVAAAGKHIGRGYPWKGFGKGHGDSPVRPSTFESKTRPPRFEGPASVEEMLKELQSVLKESSSALIAIEADQNTQMLAAAQGLANKVIKLINICWKCVFLYSCVCLMSTFHAAALVSN
ncbi:hypothetical protein Tco_0015144, partial [Tanacetum coccineum]